MVTKMVRKASVNTKVPSLNSNPGDILNSEMGNNLVKMLSTKANKEDLKKCFELKVNKIDLENMLDIQ